MPLGFILALLIKKANVVMFLLQQLNMLIQTAKTIDYVIIQGKVLK